MSFAPAVHAQPTLWFVDSAVTGGENDGSSWGDAFLDLQSALFEASQSEGGDEIWVAAGTYYPDGGTDDQSDSFYLLDDTALYGGFVGTETSRTQRDPENNPTILSGDIGDPGETDDNSYHVVQATNVGPTAVLNGFVITQGFSPSPESGSGMLAYNANPTIVRCTFIDNGDYTTHHGGGLAVLFAQNKSVTHVVNCRFLGNRAYNHAGAVVAESTENVLFDVVFDNCIFSGNSLHPEFGSHGGALSNHGAVLYLNNCTLYGNDGTAAGGAIGVHETPVVLRNCILWDNLPDQVQDTEGNAYIFFSEIEDGWTGHGSDNIDDDPMFCDPEGPDDTLGTADDNLRLQDGSPCIDAGDDEIVLPDVGDVDDDGDPDETIPWDLDVDHETAKPFSHYGRSFDVVNGPETPPATIDMGAYENQHIQDCRWDISATSSLGAPPDGEVDNLDLLKLLADWGDCPGCGADFNCDLEVGNLDYAALLTNWGECPGGESAQGGGSSTGDLEEALWSIGFEDVESYVSWLEEEATDAEGFTAAAVLAALLSS